MHIVHHLQHIQPACLRGSAGKGGRVDGAGLAEDLHPRVVVDGEGLLGVVIDYLKSEDRGPAGEIGDRFDIDGDDWPDSDYGITPSITEVDIYFSSEEADEGDDIDEDVLNYEILKSDEEVDEYGDFVRNVPFVIETETATGRQDLLNQIAEDVNQFIEKYFEEFRDQGSSGVTVGSLFFQYTGRRE